MTKQPQYVLQNEVIFWMQKKETNNNQCYNLVYGCKGKKQGFKIQ